MQDTTEAELIAAHLLPFRRDREGWIDAYINATLSDDARAVDSEIVTAAAGSAWQTHGWAHPAVVARLVQLLGTLPES